MKYLTTDKPEDQNKKQVVKKKKSTADDDKVNESNIYHNIYQPSSKVHCDFCEKDITKHAKIYCPDGEIDSCIPCFADQTETEGEQNQATQSYHVINKLSFPVYSEDWTAEEELLLIEGLGRFGFGNWQEISDHIQTGKTKEEIEIHYETYYLKKDNPEYFPGEPLLSKRDQQTMQLQYNKKSRSNSEEILRGQKFSKKKVKQLEKQETMAKKAAQATGQNLNASEIVGYMPLRGDFDVEFDNDAELLLAEMEFNEDDKPGEIEMKYKILDLYNARLDERIKRKNFVIERGLLDLKKQNMLDKERTKEEKEIYNIMKVFARFSSVEEHEKLVQGIIKEKQIRQRIEELRTYRKLGMKTFEEVEKYLLEKRKKDEAYQKRQKQHDSFLYEKPALGGRNQSRRTRSINTFIEEGKDGGDKKKQLPQNMTEQEQSLCEKLGLSSYEYLVIKEVLVREAVKEKFIKKEFAESTLKLDKDRLTGIFDFLVTHNYIMEKPN